MSNGDPVGSELPRGKSNAARKGRYDGSYTGTEQRVKDELMKQFCRDEGPPPSSAYLNAPCWCACGRLKSIGDLCAKCWSTTDPIPTLHYVSGPSVAPCGACGFCGPHFCPFVREVPDAD